jgi:hypothetical protein
VDGANTCGGGGGEGSNMDGANTCGGGEQGGLNMDGEDTCANKGARGSVDGADTCGGEVGGGGGPCGGVEDVDQFGDELDGVES